MSSTDTHHTQPTFVSTQVTVVITAFLGFFAFMAIVVVDGGWHALGAVILSDVCLAVGLIALGLREGESP